VRIVNTSHASTEPVASTLKAGRNAAFVPTQWSVILAARGKNSAESAQALEALCRAYWYPLYAYVRRFGFSPHDAQDLTQEFFARMLAQDYLEKADRDKGRFRTFLLTALKRFMANEWERACAQKRGGGRKAVTLDTELAERLYATEPGAGTSPEYLYQYRYALTLLDAAFKELQQEFCEDGRSDQFEALKPCLSAGRGEIPYAELAAHLKMEESAARVVVHRFRRRYRELFREQVARTVSEPAEIEDELRHLRAALSA
jgi:DNA-directed RNA polymerase specialized sigma24 family protein